MELDPDSFWGKVALSVFDKLVIGLIIGLTIAGYDWWKTSDARHYDEAQQEVQFGFKRAEYVKDLIPVVLDHKQDLQYRANAFGALVDTKSISSRSAINLAQVLLEDDVAEAIKHCEVGASAISATCTSYFGVDSEATYLVSELQKVMPEALPAAIDMFEYSDQELSDAQDKSAQTKNGAASFAIPNFDAYTSTINVWGNLIVGAITHNSDEQLQPYLSGDTAINQLELLCRIVHPQLTKADADALVQRTIPALRFVGASWLLNHGDDSAIQTAIVPIIARDNTDYEVRMSGAMLEYLQSSAKPSIAVTQTAMSIVMGVKNEMLESYDANGPVTNAEARYHMAQTYLQWAIEHPPIAQAVEDEIATNLEGYADDIQHSRRPLTAWAKMRGVCDAYCTLITALIDGNCVTGAPPSMHAQQALNKVLALRTMPQHPAVIDDLAKDWSRRQIEFGKPIQQQSVCPYFAGALE